MLQRERPALIVLCHGRNDILRRHQRSAIADTLSAMIDSLRQADVAAVLLGVPDPGIFLITSELYRVVAEECQVQIDDAIVPDLLRDNAFKSDQIHFNATGYRRMAEAVDRLLRCHGTL